MTGPVKIGIFTSNKSMIEHIKRIDAEDADISITIAHLGLDKSLPVARKMEEDGIEVLISRRGTSQLLRENLQVPVLSFPQSDVELILSLHKASIIGRKILLTTFRSKIQGLDDLLAIMKINTVIRAYEDSASLEEIISSEKEKGCDVVVGGPFSLAFARSHGMKTVEIRSSEDAIVTTIEDAKSVALSYRKEHEKYHRYQAIINSTSEGIIAVDRSGAITMLNSAAISLFGKNAAHMVGKPLGALIKKSRIIKAMEEERPIFDSIESVNETSFLFHHTPIILSGDVVGGVSTFKNVANVMNSEIKVRKKLSKGHVARYKIGDLVHQSKIMSDIIDRLDKYARTNSTILITGETGTGKEILAQSIHSLSPRAKNPFVSINCAAIPEQLLESELFGYEEGAFTGSRKGGKPGLFELAHTGTIFLDEISAASEAVQMRLLRVLQEREVMRLGSDERIPIDVRPIAAANHDLSIEVQKKNFRQDLYFRLNVLRVKVPPLRERMEDIPLLATFFIREFSVQYDKQPFDFPVCHLGILMRHGWPGNVRQFRNFIERLVLLCPSRFQIEVFDELYSELISFANPDSQFPYDTSESPRKKGLRQVRDENEATLIQKALYESHFNRKVAAQKLGISRSTLWRKIKELNIN